MYTSTDILNLSENVDASKSLLKALADNAMTRPLDEVDSAVNSALFVANLLLAMGIDPAEHNVKLFDKMHPDALPLLLNSVYVFRQEFAKVAKTEQLL